MEIKVYPNEIIKDKNCSFGVLYEDISYASDGGLYAEMVQNRSFEYDISDNPSFTPLTAWEKVQRGESVAQIHVDSNKPLNENNIHYLTLVVSNSGKGGGFLNKGYNSGMVYHKDEEYIFSCWYRLNNKLSPRNDDGTFAEITVQFEDKTAEQCFASAVFSPRGNEWTYIEIPMKSNGECVNDRLAVFAKEPVTIDFDMVSLFPKKTFKNRRNGLRQDIAEMIADLKPGFVRFPGGCVVHCGSLDADKHDSMYRWKNTIGKIEERPARRNRWDYSQSNGLGFFEMFQFCEDIGAEPLPVIAGGYDPHTLLAVPIENIGEWIDEALDLIEFANGTPNTKWGEVRAKMGHIKPFDMKYLCIGNEEVGEEFFERYKIIAKAIKEKYPDIKLIGSAGASSDGVMLELGYKVAEETDTDIIDEHFYQGEEWMLENYNKYMDVKEKPGILVSEYSSRDNKLSNALAEAAMMIGFEKAPCIKMASYAPLLCNADYINWKPNLIWFDNNRIYGTPSYYVQKLFSDFEGKQVIKTENDTEQMLKIPKSLTGKIAFSTANGIAEIFDISIENLLTGEKKKCENIHISSDNSQIEVFDTNWENYRFSFKCIKTKRDMTQVLAGKSALQIEFAKTDDRNKLVWDIDGWQHLTGVNGVENGHGYGLSSNLFKLHDDKSYNLCLEVKNNEASMYIDNMPYHNIRFDKIKDSYPLYCSAVTDNDMIFIKTVNAEKNAKDVCFDVVSDNRYGKAEVYYISGDKNAENSFDEPENIAIKKYDINICNNKICLKLLPYSVSVIKVI